MTKELKPEKQELKPESEKLNEKKTSGKIEKAPLNIGDTENSEFENPDFEFEDEDLEIPELNFNKKSKISKKEKIEIKKRDGFLTDTLNNTIRVIINQTSLRNCDDKISEGEMKETQFGENVAKTLNHYYPKWNFNHPVFGLVMSGVSLLVLMDKKNPMIKKSITNERNKQDNSAAGEVPATKQDTSGNPYLSLQDSS